MAPKAKNGIRDFKNSYSVFTHRSAQFQPINELVMKLGLYGSDLVRLSGTKNQVQRVAWQFDLYDIAYTHNLWIIIIYFDKNDLIEN